MKTIRNLFFVAFAAMTVAGCQEELANPNDEMQETGNVVTFTGSVENALTKTTMWYEDEEYQIGAEFPTMFMNADHITVNGTESGDLTKNDDNGTNISFTVAGVTPPYYAVTSIHVNSYENGVYTVQVNGTGNPQDYRLVRSGKAISFDSQADILAAYSKDETSLRFKHMCTFLAITVNSEGSSVPDNIKSVYIRQAGEQPNIAGKWNLTYDGEGNAPVLTPNELTEVIAYDCTDKGVAQDKAMIIGIPAYNYADGLIITIKDVNGKFASFKIPASKTDFTDMGGVITPFNPTFNPGSGEIMTAQDWNDFADAVNSGKDWELYRWLGNGTVKLGADINDDEVELKSVTKLFEYTFDGGGKSITRNKAEKSLFYEVSGEIRNLTLAGNLTLSANGAPFVYLLHAGGKITECVNEMVVTYEISSSNAYVSAFAAALSTYDLEEETSIEITSCVNKGAISGIIDVSSNSFPVSIGGIVGDARSVSSAFCKLIIKNCSNEAPITIKPKSGANETTGMHLCGLGGIAGRIRTAKSSVEFDNCDNSGKITIDAEYITSPTGLKAHPVCVGGILGIGAPISSNVLNNPKNIDGFKISFDGCNNTGDIYNCAVNASIVTEAKDKVYTGGFAGALMGNSKDYTTLVNCSNTGTVQTYDITGDNALLPGNCAVAAGFIGFGGHVDINNCIVNCKINNGKRPIVAWSGVLGFAMRPFRLQNSSVYATGYFQRMLAYKMNRSLVAVCPMNYYELNENNSEVRTKMSMVPDLTGSAITGCKIGGALTTLGKTLSTDNKSEISYTSPTTLFDVESEVENNLIAGNYSSNNKNCGYGKDIPVYNNTEVEYWDAK